MRNGIAEAAARLERDHPDWAIYWVPRATGKPVVTWHARRHDNHRLLVHAESANELEEQLEASDEQ